MRRSAPGLLALLAACAGGKSDDSALPDCSGIELEPGEGEFSWAPRDEGDTLTMVHGQQGGWHIDLAGRVAGSTGKVRVVGSVIEASQQVSLGGIGQEGGDVKALSGFDPDTCSGTFFGARIFLDDVDPGGDYQRFICTLEDNALEVTLHVTDLGTDEAVSASLRARAALDPADTSICASF